VWAGLLVRPELGARSDRFAEGREHYHVDQVAYLNQVLERLPTSRQKALGELLLDAWSEAHAGARLNFAA
jgi:hypothetical protein